MAREFLAPFPQGGLANIEVHTLLAHRLDDDVHVRMLLVSMEDHRISVLQGELLLRKPAHRRQELVWRSAHRHGEDNVMDEPGRLAIVRNDDSRSTPMGYKIEIPILDQRPSHLVPFQAVALIRFELQFSITADVLDVISDALKAPPTPGHLDHDFRRALDSSRDLVTLSRADAATSV
jgi:hypothetical protein